MSKHPLVTLFSKNERDRLLNTISFSVQPRKYHLESLSMLDGAHVVNYSLLLEAMSEQQRVQYVPLDQLKNGDILQFSDYRECGTYYCLWLSKDLVQNDAKEIQEFLDNLVDEEDEENEEGEAVDEDDEEQEAKKSKKEKYHFTALPVDFQVSFMPKPVEIQATTENFPYCYQREDPHVGGSADYHLYLFHHLDEYGFLGTSATSMASEKYFQAIKVESSSSILLDPLLVHSKSYYGRLLEVVRERRADFAPNPFFPFEYIAEVGDVIPAKVKSATEEWDDADKDAIMEQVSSITWTPINLADGSLVNAGCKASTLTPEDEKQLITIQNAASEEHSTKANLFYEIRNIICRHFIAISPSLTSISGVTRTLSLFDADFLGDNNRFEKFFIIHSSELRLHSSIHANIPSYYVENAYNIFASEKRLEIQCQVEAEQEAKVKEDIHVETQSKAKRTFEQNTYREVQNRISLAWRELDETTKNAYNQHVEVQKKQAQLIEEELPLYLHYLKDCRQQVVSAFIATSPASSWFECEKHLVRSWLSADEEIKQKYRALHEIEETKKQLAKDAQSIIRSLSMYKSMDRALLMMSRNPVAAAAQQLSDALTAKHNPEALPPQPPQELEDEYVYPPSEFNFPSSQKINGGAMMLTSSNGRRPPPGFIAFVLDTYKAWEHEKAESFDSQDELFVELISQWQVLRAADVAGDEAARVEMQKVLAREAELEEVGMKQKLVRDELRKKQREEMEARRAAARAAAGTTGTGFGGFGGFGFGSVPTIPSSSVLAPAVTAVSTAVVPPQSTNQEHAK